MIDRWVDRYDRYTYIGVHTVHLSMLRAMHYDGDDEVEPCTMVMMMR